MKGLNGSGRSPAALTLDYLRSTGFEGNEIPRTNLNSVTVPGAAAAWYDAVATWGSGDVSFAQVMAPAIRLAEQGVPTSDIHSYSVRFRRPLFDLALRTQTLDVLVAAIGEAHQGRVAQFFLHVVP